MNRREAGWTSLEVLVALTMAIIAAVSLSSAALEAFSSGARLEARAASIIESRNAISDARLRLLGK
jgi:type II secretory pathway pseudopilin PulG